MAHHRGRQRAGPPRRRAHRLRRQHQPRAEDAGRRARRAGRDARRRGRAGGRRAAWPTRWSTRPTAWRRTIDDLLELSRIELGGQALQRGGRRRAPVVAEAVDAHAPLAAAPRHRGRRLDAVAAARTSSATAASCVSAVANLVENAVKYSDPGAAVEVVGVHADGGWVELAVHDHGIGIPAGTSTASSSASTGSTGPAAARPAAPASGWRSCATSRPTTAARCSVASQRGRGLDLHPAHPARPARPPVAAADIAARQGEHDRADDRAGGRGRGVASSTP